MPSQLPQLTGDCSIQPPGARIRAGNARRVGGRRISGTQSAGSPSDAGKIRAWANEHGYEVSERGRIPKEIREAYAAAH